MINFSELNLSDANIKNVRIFRESIEVDYIDWQERSNTLRFINSIACFLCSPIGKDLSHMEIESNGKFLSESIKDMEVGSNELFYVFNFIDAWNGNKILRIIAEKVEKIT